VLADPPGVADHLAAVVDQHGDVDVAARQGGQLGAVAVRDVDDGGRALEEIEDHLDLASVPAPREPIELHVPCSTAARRCATSDLFSCHA
jgi:hypothetical protein